MKFLRCHTCRFVKCYQQLSAEKVRYLCASSRCASLPHTSDLSPAHASAVKASTTEPTLVRLKAPVRAAPSSLSIRILQLADHREFLPLTSSVQVRFGLQPPYRIARSLSVFQRSFHWIVHFGRRHSTKSEGALRAIFRAFFKAFMPTESRVGSACWVGSLPVKLLHMASRKHHVLSI